MGQEAEIEKKCCEIAQKRGWMTWKLTSPGRKGVPDRLFIGPLGLVVFIEFKGPNGTISKSQDRTIKELRRRSHKAIVIASVEDFLHYMGWGERANP